MTDKQLAAFLNLIAIRIEMAIEKAIEELPPECSETETDIFGNSYIKHPPIEPFHDVHFDLVDQIDLLNKGD